MGGDFILQAGLLFILLISRTVNTQLLPDVEIEQPVQDPEPYNPETDLETHRVDTQPLNADSEPQNTEDEEHLGITEQTNTDTETFDVDKHDAVLEPVNETKRNDHADPDEEYGMFDPWAERDMRFEMMKSKIMNASQFCKLLDIDCEVLDEGDVLGDDGEKVLVSGGESKVAKFDACNPRNQTVAIPKDPDPEISIWPTCTRALRCGGCCTSEVFSCEPTNTRERFVKVFRTRLPYKGAQRYQFIGPKSVKIIEHTFCEPQCKVKAIHCNPLQKYVSRFCRCVCTNLQNRELCTKKQVWDDNECACVCPQRKTTFCPHPSRFSDHLCKCTLMQEVAGEIDLAQLLANLGHDIVVGLNNEITVAPTTTTTEPTTTTTTPTTTTTTVPTTTPDRCGDEKKYKCRRKWKPKWSEAFQKCKCRPALFG